MRRWWSVTETSRQMWPAREGGRGGNTWPFLANQTTNQPKHSVNKCPMLKFLSIRICRLQGQEDAADEQDYMTYVTQGLFELRSGSAEVVLCSKDFEIFFNLGCPDLLRLCNLSTARRWAALHIQSSMQDKAGSASGRYPGCWGGAEVQQRQYEGYHLQVGVFDILIMHINYRFINTFWKKLISIWLFLKISVSIMPCLETSIRVFLVNIDINIEFCKILISIEYCINKDLPYRTPPPVRERHFTTWESLNRLWFSLREATEWDRAWGVYSCQHFVEFSEQLQKKVWVFLKLEKTC